MVLVRQPHHGHRLLQPMLDRHARPAPGLPQDNPGAGKTRSVPEDAGAEEKDMKVILLPGRQFNQHNLYLWHTQRSHKRFSDICLRASDREVPCNALTLAVESAFFRAKIFSPDFGGSDNVVHLEDVDGDTLETMIAALHNSTIKLSWSNVERFLHYADMLQLSVVKDACCKYMKDCLNEENAGRTLSLAEKYSCNYLMAWTQSFITGRFHSMPGDALNECTRPIFWDIISRDNLFTHTELQVLEAIIQWCDHNGVEAFLGLLPAVQLGGMYVHELRIMARIDMVREHPVALERVHAALAAANSPHSLQRCRNEPRTVRGVEALAAPPRRHGPPNYRYRPYNALDGFLAAPPAAAGFGLGARVRAYDEFGGALPAAVGFGGPPPAAAGFGGAPPPAVGYGGYPLPAVGYGGYPPPPFGFGGGPPAADGFAAAPPPAVGLGGNPLPPRPFGRAQQRPGLFGEGPQPDREAADLQDPAGGPQADYNPLFGAAMGFDAAVGDPAESDYEDIEEEYAADAEGAIAKRRRLALWRAQR